jgi:signal transduction histidine kinase
MARLVNSLAEEGHRLRAQEAESDRLRTMARGTGLRIREHLVADEVLNEARLALEKNIDADIVYLRLLDDGKLGALVGHEPGWFLPAEAIEYLPPGVIAEHEQLFRARASKVIQDVQGGDGERIPPGIRDATRQAGIHSRVLTPFGVGSDVLGIIVANRMSPHRPWTDAEVAAVESIAADLGRGLHHARMYEAENRLVEELRAVDRAKSDFLATVSHELRTPLTSIAGYVEMLRSPDAEPLTPTQERMLTTVERNTARLQHLIEDVLTLSKIESGAFKTAMQRVDLAEILTPAVAALQPAADAKGLALVADCPGHGLMVNGDPGQLDRVLMNLLSNAVKFTPIGGSVVVSAASEGAVAVLTVADTGIGIPERDRKDLFTRFFQASNAVGLSIPGKGLGLAIVRTIVDNHGGELALRSREGHGTTVSVRVPLLSFLMMAGATGDRVGRRRTFQAGLAVFTLGSLLCSLAPSLGWLMAFRGLQAVGGAMLNPVALLIIANTFLDPGERARAIGVWGAVFGLSLALGPLLGGALVGAVGWRGVFWVNIPLGILGIVLTALVVPESRASPRRPDPAGQALLTLLLAALTNAIIQGPHYGWDSPVIIGLFSVTALAAAGLAVVEPRQAEPLLDLRFFRSVPFSGGNAVGIGGAVNRRNGTGPEG